MPTSSQRIRRFSATVSGSSAVSFPRLSDVERRLADAAAPRRKCRHVRARSIPAEAAGRSATISSRAAASSDSRPSSSPRSLRRRSSSSTSPTRGDSSSPSSRELCAADFEPDVPQAREPVAQLRRVVVGEREERRLRRSAGERGDLDRVGGADELRRERNGVHDGALVLAAQREPLDETRVIPHDRRETQPPERRAGIELVAQRVHALHEGRCRRSCRRTRRGARACARSPSSESSATISSRTRSFESRGTPVMPSRASRSVSGSIRKPSRFS